MANTDVILMGEAKEKPRPAQLKQRRKLSSFGLALIAFLTFAFLYVPIFVLIFFSFNKAKTGSTWTGFTLDWYKAMFQNETLIEALGNSLVIAVSATLIAVVLGTLLAMAMERYQFKGKGLWDGLLYMPVIIPEIVAGVSLLLFFATVQMERGLLTLIIAHVSFTTPFVYMTVRARLADFDRSVEEAAMDLGANELTTFFRITLPMIMPGIVSGGLLAFTLSMDDFIISNFVKGVGGETLPVYVWPQLKRSVSPEINAASTMLLLFSICIVVISLLLQQRQKT
jgi:spermidine/putrescine transport system permease protein